jgi:hypothetical protein
MVDGLSDLKVRAEARPGECPLPFCDILIKSDIPCRSTLPLNEEAISVANFVAFGIPQDGTLH